MDFGAFVQFMPNRDGLLRISEISWQRIPDMEASGIKEGDELDVKLIEIDKKTGKYRLSLRALQPKPEGYQEPQRRERPQRREGDRNDRGDRGPRNNNHHNNNRGDRGPRNNNRE